MVLFQDFYNNKKNTKGKIVAFCFRLANLASVNTILFIFLYPYLIFYKIIFEWVMGFELPYKTSIQKGLKINHIQSIVINKNTIIGENCIIRQNLTIGNSGSGKGSPKIGNNVEIGAHVCIIGEITIGNNVIIGAGSIITKDIPDNCVVVGNPGRIIKQL